MDRRRGPPAPHAPRPRGQPGLVPRGCPLGILTVMFTPRATALDRRGFFQLSAAALVGAGAGGLPGWAAEGRPPTADALIPGKDPRLIVHAEDPPEIETPLELLATAASTPKQLLFVRNNQRLEGSLTLEPLPLAGWRIELGGLTPPRSFDAGRLADLEQTEVELVLQCSGNGRAMFSRAAPAKGSPWRHGAMGNVRFGGVRLATVFDALGVEIPAAARFLTAEGRDALPGPPDKDFEHSIPLDDALRRSLLAVRLNGERLPAVHGGPVRLVTPGYYGTMNVKWLSRLRLEAEETANYHHVRRYRTPHEPIPPGSAFESNLANSEPNWRMRIKSMFFNPLDGQRVRAGPCELRGVAFNDGACRLEAVEVTSDGGQTWHRAALDVPESPYAWHPWRLAWSLSAGEHKLGCRAVDVLGRTQPWDGAIHWNPAGYAFHGVDVIRVVAA